MSVDFGSKRRERIWDSYGRGGIASSGRDVVGIAELLTRRGGRRVEERGELEGGVTRL